MASRARSVISKVVDQVTGRESENRVVVVDTGEGSGSGGGYGSNSGNTGYDRDNGL